MKSPFNLINFKLLFITDEEDERPTGVLSRIKKSNSELYKIITTLRREWAKPKKCEIPERCTQEQLDELVEVPKINLVATRGENDEKELLKYIDEVL